MADNKNINDRKCVDDLLPIQLDQRDICPMVNTLNNGRIACMHMYAVSMCAMEIIEAMKKESLLFFNVYLSIRMWTNNELLIKSYDGRNERTVCMSTSSSSERLASVCICTKKNRKRALFFIQYLLTQRRIGMLLCMNMCILSSSSSPPPSC